MEAYILKHKDFRTRLLSRSGGFFTAISDYVLEHNGVIYGAVQDGDFIVRHKRADSICVRDLMRGVKYTQSQMGECFSSAKQDLDRGISVLFTGTPCQIDGLLNFLGKNYEHLITVDNICHGVVSPDVWQEYVKNFEARKKVSEAVFRNKYKFGWKDHHETIIYTDGTSCDSTNFADLYNSGIAYRACCYSCRYNSLDRLADFTVGDAWGIDQYFPEFNDDNGVSLLLSMTPKADRLLKIIRSNFDICKIDINDFESKILEAPSINKHDRDRFWNDKAKMGIWNAMQKAKVKLERKRFVSRLKRKLHLK